MAGLEKTASISFLFDEIITGGAVLSAYELCEALRELGHECNIVSKHSNEELEEYFGITPIQKPKGTTITFTPKLKGDFAYVRTKDDRWLTHKEPKIAVSEFISSWCGAETIIGNGTASRFKNNCVGKDIDILITGNDEPNKNIEKTIEKAKELTKEIDNPKICWFGRRTHPIKGIECISNPAIEDIPTIYNRARTFLSYSICEGFSRPVAEATKCGCSIINLNGGNRDVKVVSWEVIAQQLLDYVNGGEQSY